MGHRTAKFISALVGSIIAGAPLAAESQNAPAAASAAAADCLASPKGVAPQGQHWHYRLERSTKRQCWYLRAEGGKDNAKDSAKPVQSAQAEPTPPDSAAPQHPVQDARAEYLKPQTAAAPTAPAQAVPTTSAPAQQVAPPSADGSAQQPAVASPWPDPTAAASPAPQPAPAPVAAVAPPGTKPSKSPAPMALAAADSSADTGSLQMLLLVVGGALALAGILASIIYRFAGGRVRRQVDRRAHWDDWEPQDQDPIRAPWLDAMPAEAVPAQQSGPVDFDAVRPQSTQLQAAQPKAAQLAAFSDAIGRIAAQSAPAHNAIADFDEAGIFNGTFEIEESAPRLAADDAHDEAPADRDEDEDVRIEDAVDVDVITAILERLAQEGPRLKQPSLEADLAEFAQIPRGQSAARA